MFEIILGKAASGKTVELIKKSAETGIYILVTDKTRAKMLFEMARELGYYIPMPVTVEDFTRNRFHGSVIRHRGLYIDDIDCVLQKLFGYIQIHAGTLRTDERCNNVTVVDFNEVTENES